MSKEQVKKYYGAALVVFIAVFSFFIWTWVHKTDLFELQREMAVTKSRVERQKILKRLDNYYLTMSIPDSFWNKVRAEVDNSIQLQMQCPSIYIHKNLDSINYYQFEDTLRHVVRQALISRIKKDSALYQNLVNYASCIAQKIDTKKQIQYWMPWTKIVENFNIDDARSWLMADQAQELCRTNLLMSNSEDAEKCGALGLQLLEKIEDLRLRLDFEQRLMTILFRSQGLYDLALYYGERAYENAKKINYILRTNGLAYNCAEVLHQCGKNNSALDKFNEAVKIAEDYHNVPQIKWYRKNGLLGVARSNWQLGNYELTLSLCQDIEKLDLDKRGKMLLHITRGISHRSLGNYDTAIIEYQKACEYVSPRDAENKIHILRNIGMTYHRLQEYDRAIEYFSEALELHRKEVKQHNVMKAEVLICLAESYAAQEKTEEFDQCISNVQDIINQVDIPNLKASILRSLGHLEIDLNNYAQASDHFSQSCQLYEESGLLRSSLETKIDYAQCLFELSKYEDTKKLLEEILVFSMKIEDSQRKIEALELCAKISAFEGDLDEAIRRSNQLINEVESVSGKFINIDNLKSFQKKVHECLRNAVIYELKKGREDSAFIKLDYAKARSLKNKSQFINGKTEYNPSHFIDLNSLKSRLKNKQLLISYFISEDSLYAFVVDNQDLKLEKKSINKNDLQRAIDDYARLIKKSIVLFSENKPNIYQSHFDSTSSISQKLYEYLLGWEELQSNLSHSELTFIVPDAMLYDLPFASLMNRENEPGEFLIQRTAVSYLPSAIFLQTKQQKPAEAEILNKKIMLSASRIIPDVDDLRDWINKSFSSVEDLTCENLGGDKKELLSKLNQHHEVYIFFGHSKPNKLFPDSSYLEVAVRQGEKTDFSLIKLTLDDFKKIDWSNAELILLLGCETAIGKKYEGTGLAGIQQTIFACGGKAILATLWKVDAQKVCEQSKLFLKFLLETNNPSIALQKANIESIKKLRNHPFYKKPHPYLWGSFILLQSNPI